tara:strand:+ start:584 stop:751 length:168 start_codon:yes stop_codon:yes gene_type:complete
MQLRSSILRGTFDIEFDGSCAWQYLCRALGIITCLAPIKETQSGSERSSFIITDA